MSRRLLLAAMLAGAVVAQDPTSPTTLHHAWMREVLDLDTAAAAKLYREVVADRSPLNRARWVAAARLTELQRLDVAGGARVDFTEAPPLLRPRFEEADDTLELSPLIERVAAEPARVLQETATPEGRLPSLRPIVMAAESWFVDQALPSRLDSIRQRRAAYFANRPPFTARVFAARVLSAELDGRRAEADARRSLYFTSWEPPPPPPDPEAALARIRHHMAEMLLEREWTSRWRRFHERFSDTVDRIAADDPAAAVALVRRLPQYAERLLAPIPEEGR